MYMLYTWYGIVVLIKQSLPGLPYEIRIALKITNYTNERSRSLILFYDCSDACNAETPL